MYLIKAKTNEGVQAVASDVDNLDDFEYLDLGDINTLELTEINPESSSWATGEPLAFNEEVGIVLLPFSKESLNWLKGNVEMLEEYGVSKESVFQFCSECSDNLYCLDTF
ncbi:MAG: hypothetical protein P8171_18645 [Candidatus Thiodiazotropha sp.]|jgi:hypothetical protein